MNVVHHCRNLVALYCVKLILLCWSPSLLQDLSSRLRLSASACLRCLLDRGRKDDLSNLVLKTFDVPSSGGLIESISLSLELHLGPLLSVVFFLLENWNPPRLSLNRIRNFSTALSHLHLNCGTCPCIVTRSSTTLLMNCGWRNSTVCACSCGASFISATVFSKIGSGTCTSMICSTIRSGTCSWHVSFVCEQPSSRVQSMLHCQVLSVSSPNPSVDMFP